jgi:glycosyltransferase involved in cell wall biosynthesis
VRTLVVTNDFPPRQGGIQTFVAALLARRPPDSLVVLASRSPGWEEYDAALPYPVVRRRTGMLLPTPGAARAAADLARRYGCDTAFFGAAAPLGLLAPALRAAGIGHLVGATHGHETGWVALPGARQLMRRIAGGLDVVTYISEYTHERLAPALDGAARLAQLSPGVDVDLFTPDADGAAVRERYGLGDAPVVVCVSRLVPRKGQDMLIRALPAIRRRVPGAALLLGSGGPYRSKLERLTRDLGVEKDVVFTGSVPWSGLPALYAAGDVYAMPCRTRAGGLDVEGLGIVYLEASATGLPVVAGDSGGAPDAVLEGETGYVVGGRDVPAIAGRVADLLGDPDRAKAMGSAGRAWVEREWRWERQADRLQSLIASQ